MNIEVQYDSRPFVLLHVMARQSRDLFFSILKPTVSAVVACSFQISESHLRQTSHIYGTEFADLSSSLSTSKT